MLISGHWELYFFKCCLGSVHLRRGILPGSLIWLIQVAPLFFPPISRFPRRLRICWGRCWLRIISRGYLGRNCSSMIWIRLRFRMSSRWEAGVHLWRSSSTQLRHYQPIQARRTQSCRATTTPQKITKRHLGQCSKKHNHPPLPTPKSWSL